MIFVGFDLHKRYITACALNGAGEIIAEIRQRSTGSTRCSPCSARCRVL